MSVEKKAVTEVLWKMIQMYGRKQTEYSEFSDMRSAQRMHDCCAALREAVKLVEQLEENRNPEQGFEVRDLEPKGF